MLVTVWRRNSALVSIIEVTVRVSAGMGDLSACYQSTRLTQLGHPSWVGAMSTSVGWEHNRRSDCASVSIIYGLNSRLGQGDEHVASHSFGVWHTCLPYPVCVIVQTVNIT